MCAGMLPINNAHSLTVLQIYTILVVILWMTCSVMGVIITVVLVTVMMMMSQMSQAVTVLTLCYQMVFNITIWSL